MPFPFHSLFNRLSRPEFLDDAKIFVKTATGAGCSLFIARRRRVRAAVRRRRGKGGDVFVEVVPPHPQHSDRLPLTISSSRCGAASRHWQGAPAPSPRQPDARAVGTQILGGQETVLFYLTKPASGSSCARAHGVFGNAHSKAPPPGPAHSTPGWPVMSAGSGCA